MITAQQNNRIGIGPFSWIDEIDSYHTIEQEVAENQAELIIAVGNPNFNTKVNQWNDYTRALFRWYFDKTKNVPVFNNQHLDKLAYTGLVGRFVNGSNSNLIFAYGTNIEGDVAAIKKLISAKDIFLTPLTLGVHHEVVVDRYDKIGLSVMDLMHNKENQPYFNAKSGTNGNYFRDIVEDILLDNNYEVAIKTVQTTEGTSYGQNTTLRLKNLNSDHSDNFKDAILNNTKPVVMSGGIFSDLFTFEDGLGGDLVKARYDVWTIEIRGKEFDA